VITTGTSTSQHEHEGEPMTTGVAPGVTRPRIAAEEPMLIGESWTCGSGGRVAVLDPATEELLTTVGLAGPAEVDAAVAAATAAHRDGRWRGRTPEWRRDPPVACGRDGA